MSTDRKRLREYACRAALAHWGQLLERVRAGEDLAAELEEQFLDADEEGRLRLAREFSSEEHLAALTANNPPAVKKQLSPWLEQAINLALDSSFLGGKSEEKAHELQEELLEDLVSRQYVIVVVPFVEHAYSGSPAVTTFPDGMRGYNDLYEHTAAGYSVGATVHLYKATGEAFAPSEREKAFEFMHDDFTDSLLDAGDEEPWQFLSAGDWDDRMIEVRVYERFDADDDHPPGEAVEI